MSIPGCCRAAAGTALRSPRIRPALPQRRAHRPRGGAQAKADPRNPANDATPPKLRRSARCALHRRRIRRMLELAVPERIDRSIYTSIDLVVMLLMARASGEARRAARPGVASASISTQAASPSARLSSPTFTTRRCCARRPRPSGSARTISPACRRRRAPAPPPGRAKGVDAHVGQGIRPQPATGVSSAITRSRWRRTRSPR